MTTYPATFFTKICPAILLLSLAVPVSGQTTTYKPGKKGVHNPANIPDVLAIRKEYQRINKAKLMSEQFTYQSEGCVEDGKASFYFLDKAIVKITESGSIGDGSWLNTIILTVNWYFVSKR